MRAAIPALLEERLALMAPARRLRLALADELLCAEVVERPIRLLDAGAGDGLLSLALAKRHPRWTVFGVDVRDDMLDGARARARGRGLTNVEFLAADLTRPLPQSGFDAVIALELLEEISDDEAAVQAIAAALAPGGLLVAQVPERSWRSILPGSPSIWREQVRQGYSADEIAALLRRAGLNPIEVRPTFRATAIVAQEIRDRIKDSSLAVRAAAFPAMLAAVRLERWGITGGAANALLVSARKPPASPAAQRT